MSFICFTSTLLFSFFFFFFKLDDPLAAAEPSQARVGSLSQSALSQVNIKIHIWNKSLSRKHWTLQSGADGVRLAADLSLDLLTRPVSVRVVTSCFTFKTVKQNLVVAAHHESVCSSKQGRIGAESCYWMSAFISYSWSRAEAKQAELMPGKKAEAGYFLSQWTIAFKVVVAMAAEAGRWMDLWTHLLHVYLSASTHTLTTPPEAWPILFLKVESSKVLSRVPATTQHMQQNVSALSGGLLDSCSLS